MAGRQLGVYGSQQGLHGGGTEHLEARRSRRLRAGFLQGQAITQLVFVAVANLIDVLGTCVTAEVVLSPNQGGTTANPKDQQEQSQHWVILTIDPEK